MDVIFEGHSFRVKSQDTSFDTYLFDSIMETVLTTAWNDIQNRLEGETVKMALDNYAYNFGYTNTFYHCYDQIEGGNEYIINRWQNEVSWEWISSILLRTAEGN